MLEWQTFYSIHKIEREEQTLNPKPGLLIRRQNREALLLVRMSNGAQVCLLFAWGS